ncbi:hypothetical protein OPT61_g4902 [Boeremia exigua]|uniref:Uncharacterized protein n=1 Tax=Boeremia exigua TaxID=749465 RepID=A0ACC2IC96_9PLEO|nr:hypothetical protein OPT61_g4902 [Boeremia exigua]
MWCEWLTVIQASLTVGSCDVSSMSSPRVETSRVQADLCNLPEESKVQEITLYTGVVYSIAFLSVTLRIAGKMVSKRLSWDDIVVVAGLLLVAIPVGCVLHTAPKGFGDHLWNLEDGNLQLILHYLYFAWLTYVIVFCMIKVSLVLFYLEIFDFPRFKMIAYIFMAYIIMNSFAMLFVAIFPCRPVHSFWNRDIRGKCIDIQATAYANSGSALVQDLILLILPLSFIRNLQMQRSRKIAVGFMLCIGAFGCIATIMRLPSLSTFKISTDPSWDYISITIWTELELAAGFLCVSLPSIRMLFVHVHSKLVKGLITIPSHASRSKNIPSPQFMAPRAGKDPAAWIDISGISSKPSASTASKDIELLTIGSGARGSFISAI